MHRPTVGILAVALLVLGGALLVAPANPDDWVTYSAACLRMGAILAVLWLALPQVTQLASRWVLLGVVLAVFVLAKRPQIFVQLLVLAVVALAVAAVLRPRLKSYLPRGR